MNNTSHTTASHSASHHSHCLTSSTHKHYTKAQLAEKTLNDWINKTYNPTHHLTFQLPGHNDTRQIQKNTV